MAESDSFRVALLALASAFAIGCGGGTGAASIVETLHASYSVEEVTVSRGEVRLAGPYELDERATEIDVVAGRTPACARPIGGGVHHRAWMVWRLSTKEIGTALGCGSSLWLRPGVRGRAARVVSPLALALGVDLASLDQPAATAAASLDFEGDDAVLTLVGTTHGVVLSAKTFTVGATETSDDGNRATFRVPTHALVDLALSRSPIRVVSDSARSVLTLTLSVDGREAAVEVPPTADVGPAPTEEEPDQRPEIVFHQG